MEDASVRTVRVELERDPYDVTIGDGVLAALGGTARACVHNAAKAMLVVDDNLPDATIKTARESLESFGFVVASESVRALEVNKSLATVERLLVACERARMDRGDLVVALGGGIVGDVAGFVAASYRRGVAVIQCPTTLLSMVDASVGGKTGVNLDVDGALRKNMVGAFWQPRAVIADTSTLKSLPPRVLRAGLGECLKHGLLCGGIDEGLFEWTVERLDAVLTLDGAVVTELIARGVAVKASVVAGDERETSADGPGRAALNLGHTFAHAIETIPHLSPSNTDADAPLLHGEAVMYGLVAALAVAEELGRVPSGACEEMRGVLSRLGLPLRLDGFPANDGLIERMQADKKVVGGSLRVVLPGAERRVSVERVEDVSTLGIGWSAIRGV